MQKTDFSYTYLSSIVYSEKHSLNRLALRRTDPIFIMEFL